MLETLSPLSLLVLSYKVDYFGRFPDLQRLLSVPRVTKNCILKKNLTYLLFYFCLTQETCGDENVAVSNPLRYTLILFLFVEKNFFWFSLFCILELLIRWQLLTVFSIQLI